MRGNNARGKYRLKVIKSASDMRNRPSMSHGEFDLEKEATAC